MGRTIPSFRIASVRGMLKNWTFSAVFKVGGKEKGDVNLPEHKEFMEQEIILSGAFIHFTFTLKAQKQVIVKEANGNSNLTLSSSF